MRHFETGATRDDDKTKPDYIGYMSPLVKLRFGQYMLAHQTQADGTKRASDNWKRGIPPIEYLRSADRHLLDVWLHEEGYPELAREGREEALCALLFNVQGYLHEVLKGHRTYE